MPTALIGHMRTKEQSAQGNVPRIVPGRVKRRTRRKPQAARLLETLRSAVLGSRFAAKGKARGELLSTGSGGMKLQAP